MNTRNENREEVGRPQKGQRMGKWQVWIQLAGGLEQETVPHMGLQEGCLLSHGSLLSIHMTDSRRKRHFCWKPMAMAVSG